MSVVRPSQSPWWMKWPAVLVPGNEEAQGSEAVFNPRQRLEDVYIVTNWFTELRRLVPDL